MPVMADLPKLADEKENLEEIKKHINPLSNLFFKDKRKSRKSFPKKKL